MLWAAYKVLCDRPDFWSKWMLHQCIDLLTQVDEVSLAELLEQGLDQPPLPKPDDHKGPSTTDMYQLHLSVAQRQRVLFGLQAALQAGLTTAATKSRGAAGFVEAWQEYVSFEDAVACTVSS